MRDSIRRFGVVVPVLFDQRDDLVDGHHRVRIADELGLPYPKATVELPDDPREARELLASLNDDRRQRMTREQRRQVVYGLYDAGHSQQAIANALDVTQPTVSNDLAARDDAESTIHKPLSNVPTDASRGTDGRRYPRRRLTPENREDIARAIRQGAKTAELAEQYGVTQGHISNVARAINMGEPSGQASRRLYRPERKTWQAVADNARALSRTLAGLDAAQASVDFADDIPAWQRAMDDCRRALGSALRTFDGKG